MADVEVYTPLGVLVGATADDPATTDPGGAPAPVSVQAGHFYALEGGEPVERSAATVDPDEIVAIAAATPELGVHAQWYPIELDAGPYHLEGHLPTAPGFDPARALSRPGGAYVLLRDVTLSLPGRPEAGTARREAVHVNRYAVERVRSSLMLGFFFPAAEPLRPTLGAGPPLVAGRSAA